MTLQDTAQPTQHRPRMASHDRLVAIVAVAVAATVATIVVALGLADARTADVRACEYLDAPAEIRAECIIETSK